MWKVERKEGMEENGRNRGNGMYKGNPGERKKAQKCLFES